MWVRISSEDRPRLNLQGANDNPVLHRLVDLRSCTVAELHPLLDEGGSRFSELIGGDLAEVESFGIGVHVGNLGEGGGGERRDDEKGR